MFHVREMKNRCSDFCRLCADDFNLWNAKGMIGRDRVRAKYIAELAVDIFISDARS